MKKEEYKIHIIGAGVSGLVAAKVLEDNGYSSIIIDSSERVGGRVKTDIVNGFQLDHGFQVLLTAYPAAQKYLDFKALDLQFFLPGACIFKNNKQKIIGDPLREKSFLFSTLFSGIGNFSDKFKILKLNSYLKEKSISDIFSAPEKYTDIYLKDFGFSNEMINDFFKPFFSGIFLESKLETSSRMFEFIYKMFGEGSATIPKAGIEEIPKQLFRSLKHTTLKGNTKVLFVNDNEIVLDYDRKLESDFTIVATNTNNLFLDKKEKVIEWESCYTLYFETEDKVIEKQLIGLIAKENTLINNIFYHTSLGMTVKTSKQLLSVTIIDDQNLEIEKLVEEVKQELKKYCAIDSCNFIKHYKIPMSLPKLTNLKYEKMPVETALTDHIFLAGDTQLNGSLNAAMISGEKAALGVIEVISQRTKK